MASPPFANPRQFPRYAAPESFNRQVQALMPHIGEDKMDDHEISRQWALRQQAAREKHAPA